MNIETLNWQGPPWEGDQGGVKRTGRMNQLGCNTYMYGNNTRTFPVYLPLSQTSKNTMFLFLSYVFSSTKPENRRAEQFLQGR
jgi:hypothetical protein